jgi:hypothetical protein
MNAKETKVWKTLISFYSPVVLPYVAGGFIFPVDCVADNLTIVKMDFLLNYY